MDWSKAKNIIIVALIATNLFLLFTYMTKNQPTEKAANQEVILTVLEGKSVFVDVDIPQKVDKLPAVTISYSKQNNNLIEKNLKKAEYSLSAKAKAEDYHRTADKFLADCKISGDDLIFDRVVTEGKETTVIYRNCYKDMPIEGRFVELSFFDGKLKNITRQFFTAMPQGKKKLNIISPEEALLMFMSEKNSEDVVHVKNMELVFWINDAEFGGEALISDTAFPAWAITYSSAGESETKEEEENTKYIDAYKK